MEILRQWSSRFGLLGLKAAHQLSTARVFPHVNTAFVAFETEATNLPLAQLFGSLPRPNFPSWPALAKAFDAHTVSPLTIAHICAPQKKNTALKLVF